MDLGARLQAVAGLVFPGQVAADIGTDHAYLPVALVLQHTCPRVIASDKNEGPCQSARRIINKYGLNGQIEVRCGDGLAVLQPGEVATIVVAGMGGKLICEIMQAAPVTAKTAERLVLQPQKDSAYLRRFLAENGWRIIAERVAQENGFFYPIIAASCGQMPLTTLEAKYGPCLMRERSPVFLDMLRRRRREIAWLLAQLAKEKSVAAAMRGAALRAEDQELAVIMRNDRFDN